MNIDAADRALRLKGFYLSSVTKMGSNLGYVASSRLVRTPNVTATGEGGFGPTPELAVRNLLEVHDVKAPTEPLADLETAIDDLIRALR